MRILFHHRIGSRDGQSVHMEELIAALRRHGHEVMIVGPAGFASTRFGGSNALVDRIKRWLPPAAFELLEVVYNVKAIVSLVRAARSFVPDVIYERFSLFLFAGIWVRRLTGVPLLLEVNAPLYEERAKNDGLCLHRLGRWAQRLIWTHVDHVLPVSGVLGGIVQDYGVPAAHITVIPNGIDLRRFASEPDAEAAKAALGLSGRTVLGFTGFIRGWNAVHRMLDFAARHRSDHEIHVLVVGDGPARDSLQAHAQKLGVADRLTITGIVERDVIAHHIAAFDVAVLPGVTPYSSPLKLFEYLQLGRAVVAPDMENIKEVLTDGHDALLFDPEQEGSLEQALLRLCNDRLLRNSLGANARQTILEKRLTWDCNAQKVVAISKRLRRASRVRPIPGHRPGIGRSA